MVVKRVFRTRRRGRESDVSDAACVAESMRGGELRGRQRIPGKRPVTLGNGDLPRLTSHGIITGILYFCGAVCECCRLAYFRHTLKLIFAVRYRVSNADCRRL